MPDPPGGGLTVITSTRRLARHLRNQDDRRQLQAGRRAWLPLDVLPWESWIEREWRRCRDVGVAGCDRRLLGPEQERVVWEQVTASLPGLDALLMPGRAAMEARTAWGLLRDYAVAPESLKSGIGPDTRLFLLASERYDERCRQRGWASAGDLAWHLATAAEQGHFAPARLILAGFDRLTPVQEILLKRLRATGTELQTWRPARSGCRPRVQGCADPSGELAAAAEWAGSILRSRPDASVGLVILDLEQRRLAAADALGDVLDPGQVLPGHISEPRAWNLSLGSRLSDWPLVDAALLCLGLWLRKGSHTDLGRLLRSPYLGGGRSEAGARAQLDLWLRAEGVCALDLAGLLRLTAGDGAGRRPAVPALAARLEALAALAEDRRESRTMDDWAGVFRDVLNALGWPGDRTLESAEYQTVDKWQNLLSRFAGLTAVSGPQKAAAALDQLVRMAAEEIFQPETPPAPVQVLGLLETPGLAFDALWVAGLHDLAWPRPLRPNPLLPVRLQREAGMPRCCPAEELAFATRTGEALVAAAGELVFSWPRQDQDETLRPSSLLISLPAGEADPEPAGLAPGLFASSRLESLPDAQMRPLAPGTVVRGGSGVLRAQSACPFQAQARYRLGAADVEVPSPGVSPLISGQIAHRALQCLWRDWGRPEVPGNMAPDDRRELVLQAVMAASEEVLGGVADVDPAILELEHLRLCGRILELVAVDLGREPFLVASLEEGTQARIAGLTFGLRLDRVDRLDDGALLFIDYKTGKASVGDWAGDRPREPQLPMYASAVPGDVGGVAFGSLAAGEVGYRGFARREIPGTQIGTPGASRRVGADDWESLRAGWEATVSGLARAFASGDARVDPRRLREDCRWCRLAALCRRHELQEQGALEDG